MVLIVEKTKRRKRVLTVDISDTDATLIFRKKQEHRVKVPKEIGLWVQKVQHIIDWLIYDSPIAVCLRHPHSVRTLVYLLYARANDIPIAQLAKRLNIAHEQLYRLERLLMRAGIKDDVYAIVKSLTLSS